MTKDEMIFVKRMLPHFLSGMSAVDAAKAVLGDDERIFNAFHDRSSSHYVPTADDCGKSYTTRTGTGNVIVSEISKTVYEALRAV